MVEVFVRLLVGPVGDSFSGINRTATSNTNDGINRGVFLHDICCLVQLCYWSMLLDIGEGACVVL